MQMRKEEIKLFLFAYDIIIYVVNLMESTKQTSKEANKQTNKLTQILELISEFRNQNR